MDLSLSKEYLMIAKAAYDFAKKEVYPFIRERDYKEQFDAERHLRNARGSMIYEGTREIHTLLQAEYALCYK